MDLNVSKGLCLFLLLIDTLAFGWPPYLLIRGKNSSPRSIRIRGIIISYLNCFAGGVFLGACLLHLLAEGQEEMEEYLIMANLDITFPMYELAVSVGFFLIAIVEQVAHKFLHNPQNVHPSKETPSGGSTDIVLTQIKRSGNNSADGVDNVTFRGESNPDSLENGLEGRNGKSVTVSGVDGNGSDVGGGQGQITSWNPPKDNTEGPTSGEQGEEAMPDYVKAMGGSPLKAFLLLGALSFHTVFDGLAIGLQDTNTAVWEIFVAIVIHKSLVAVCLGLQLFLVYKSKPLRAFAWVFFFSLIAPLGVGIAMIMTAGSMNILAEKLASWILQGIATGTFLYVTFFEILKDELTENGGILKIFVIIIGFAGMAVAKFLDN